MKRSLALPSVQVEKSFSFLAVLGVSAHARPKCVKGQTPFALSGDTISWTISIAPGTECIQGLRWSHMQIYSVLLSKAPKTGKVTILGSGFRYVAAWENHEPDSFTLVIL